MNDTNGTAVSGNGLEPETFDGQFYLRDNGKVYITYFALSTLGIIFGPAGNMVIIMTILFNKKLRLNPAYMLMLNLSVSDLGISTIVHTFTDIGIFLGEEFYQERHGLCIFLAAFCVIDCVNSLVKMGIFGVNL